MAEYIVEIMINTSPVIFPEMKTEIEGYTFRKLGILKKNSEEVYYDEPTHSYRHCRESIRRRVSL